MTAKQTTEVLESASTNAANLPKSMSIEAIRARHEQHKTEFSEELYQSIIKHASSLDINNDEKVKILARELSIYQAIIRYIDINKILFRSQYNLFCSINSNGGQINKEDANLFLRRPRTTIKKHSPIGIGLNILPILLVIALSMKIIIFINLQSWEDRI